jgi:hypothetical protein
MSALSKVGMSVFSSSWSWGLEAADPMGVVLMSKRELNRIDVLAWWLHGGRLTTLAAVYLMRVAAYAWRKIERRRRAKSAGL